MAEDTTQVFLLRTQLRTHGRVWTINAHWQVTAAYDADTSSNTLTQWGAENMLAPLVACLSDDTTVEGFYAVHVRPGVALPSERAMPSTPGGIASPSLPPNTTAVIGLLADSPELQRGGRLYLGGIARSATASGKLASGFVTGALTPFANLFKTPQVKDGMSFRCVVVKRVEGGLPVSPPTAVPVTSTRVSDILYTQRRRTSRQIGVGA